MVRVPDDVIKNLLRGACPERERELVEFYRQYQPEFELARDGRGTKFSARKNRIAWSHKTIAHDWLLAFAGWKVFVAYMPPILTAHITTGELTDDLLAADDGLVQAEQVFDEVTYCARLARDADTFESVPWPESIPPLTDDRESIPTTEGKAAFDLACIALAATFLHEFRHVQFWKDENAPPDSQQEERACDAFSRAFLLERVTDYCQSSNADAQRVVSKRIMGLATAAYVIDEASPRGLAAGISDTHPATSERFRSLVLEADAPDDADCWTYAASLVLASLRRSNRLPKCLSFSSMRDLSHKLVGLL